MSYPLVLDEAKSFHKPKFVTDQSLILKVLSALTTLFPQPFPLLWLLRGSFCALRNVRCWDPICFILLMVLGGKAMQKNPGAMMGECSETSLSLGKEKSIFQAGCFQKDLSPLTKASLISLLPIYKYLTTLWQQEVS